MTIAGNLTELTAIELRDRIASGSVSAGQAARAYLDAIAAREPALRAYIVKLVRRTRTEPTLSLGASPRAAVALFRASQALALIGGRDYVVPDDVKAIAPAVLRHRVTLTPDAEVEGATADARVEAILRAVEAPR